jgi:DNA transposition AAA+ family ATPase
MNATEKQKTLEALEGYLKLHEMSANDFSKKSGVSASYISALRNGADSYDAGGGKMVKIADKYLVQIAQFLGLSFEKVYWRTQETPQLKRILATLEDAQSFGYTNVIIGETGCGKSHAARLFEKQNPKDFFLITVGQSDNLGDLIDKVIDRMKLNDIPRSKSAKLRFITQKMRELKLNGLRPVLCFDEAEYMKQPALCAMKELFDNLSGVCAIQLIGTDQLIKKIDSLKKRNKDGIPQLYRRIKFGIRMLPNIDRTFKMFLNDVDAQLKRFLQANCDNYGELHDVLVPAMREADRLGEPLTENLVRKILNFNS